MPAITTSALAEEIAALVKSAGSETSIQDSAPGLVSLILEAGSRQEIDSQGHVIESGRQLLLAGIEWLREMPGRSADPGRRDQYPFATYAEAATCLFGEDAAQFGTEHRWGLVATTIGSDASVTITGKRLGKRVFLHLANAIVARLSGVHVAANVEPRHRPPLDAGARLLLERTQFPGALLEFARAKGLLRDEPWLSSISAALTHSLMDTGGDLRSLERLSTSTGDWDAADRLAVDLLLFESAKQMGTEALSPGGLLGALASPENSRALPAGVTHLREAASLVLFKWNIPRPGTDVDNDSKLPNVILVPLDPNRPRRFVQNPITMQQYVALIDAGDRLTARDLTLPVTSVTKTEANAYCAKFRARASESKHSVRVHVDGLRNC